MAEERFKGKMRIIEKDEIDFDCENKSEVIYSWSIYGLNPDQQEIVEQNKTNKNILEIAKLVFKDKSLTENTTEFDKVKRFYTKLKRRDSGGKGSVGLMPLSSTQIEYVYNNAFCNKPQELAFQLFESKQTDVNFIRWAAQTIGYLVIAFDIEYIGPSSDILEDHELYNPPIHDADVLARIRAATGQRDFEYGKLDRAKKECIRLLKKWLSSGRFLAMINGQKTKELRKVCEDEFIGAVYDKPDLTTEDVNGYISLANEYARELSLTSQVHTFEKLAEDAAKGDDEEKRFNKNITDALKSAREELDKCKNRMARLRADLGGSLSKRKELNASYSNSFYEMVVALRDENQRAKLLAAAAAYNEKVLQKEIDRVVNHPPEVAETYGVSIKEILGFNQTVI